MAQVNRGSLGTRERAPSARCDRSALSPGQMTFADVEAWMVARQLSLSKASRLLGVARATISAWRLNEAVPPKYVERVREALARCPSAAEGPGRLRFAEVLIERLGGDESVAARFGITLGSVADWRVHGIPACRVKHLREIAPCDAGIATALRGADVAAAEVRDEMPRPSPERDGRHAYRRARLSELVDQHFGGRQLSLSEATGLSPSYIGNMLCAPKRRGHRRVSDDMVRRIEGSLSIPGWFSGRNTAPSAPHSSAAGAGAASLLPSLEAIRARVSDREWEGLAALLAAMADR